MVSDDRLEAIEQHTADLEQRLRRVERQLRDESAAARPEAARSVGPPARAARPVPARPEAPRPAPASPLADLRRGLELPAGRRELDWEQLVGGRVLAWAGAVAVLAGLVLLFALGVSQGWIGEAARTLMGAAGAGLLVAAGAWLHERRGRTEAARAAVAAGVAGLFLADAVAAREYGLIPAAAGLAVALAVGALGAGLALRWRSQVVAAVGLVGAMLSPALAEAPVDSTSVPFLVIATAAAAAIAVREGWGWLGVAVALVAAPQWLTYVLDADAPLLGAVAVLVAFGALHASATVGHDLKVRAAGLRTSSALLLALNAVVLGAAGWFAVDDVAGEAAAVAWLAALALAHALAGVALRRRSARDGGAAAGANAADRGPGAAADAGLLSIGLAVLLADAGFALAVDGPARAIGWAAAAVGFAALARRGGVRRDGALAGLGLGGHVALAALQALTALEPAQLAGPGAGAGSVTALGALAAACLVSARLADRGHACVRTALDSLGLAAVAGLALLTLDGVALTAALAMEALVLCRLGRALDDELARVAAFVHLGAAALWMLADQAPVSALVDGPHAIAPALAGCAAVGLAALAAYATSRRGDPARAGLAGAGAVALLHGASLAAVGLAPEADGAVLELGALQQGQLQLSTLWALVGVGALVAGLRHDLRNVRLAALGLLGLTTGKVFLYDLAALTAGYRIGSFLALGVLLLAGSYAYARLRPVSAAARPPGR